MIKQRKTTVKRLLAMLLCIAFLTLRVSADTAGADSTETAVALLEPEYLTELITRDVHPDDRALEGWLDVILHESLAAQDDFIMVERQLIDDLLAERELDRLDPEAADAELRPFLAAGVLVCPVIFERTRRGWAAITVQAVLTQTGAMLAEMIFEVEKNDEGDWRMPDDIDESLGIFTEEMRSQLALHLGMQSFEVSGINVKSGLERLQWRADDLADGLSFAHYPGFVLLTPRRPLHTKEERLLRLMGLSEAATDDGAARLAAPSDFQITGELAEETKVGVSFDRTPVTLTLRIERAGREMASGEWSSTAGEYEVLREKTMNWVGEQLREVADAPAEELDESHAKMLARREIEKARRLARIRYVYAGAEKDRKLRMAAAARRAWHLDPSCEEAAYLTVTTVRDEYTARGLRHALVARRRRVELANRYIEMFGDTEPSHYAHVLSTTWFAAANALSSTTHSDDTPEILLVPDEQRYFFARAKVYAALVLGVRGDTGPMPDSPAHMLKRGVNALRVILIPSIPDGKVDEEYVFWRGFWREHAGILKEVTGIPWEWIEMGFAARKRNPDAVRSIARQLENQYPDSWCDIWSDIILNFYLRMAGVPDSETRKDDNTHPAFQSSRPEISTIHAFRFGGRNEPSFFADIVDPWDPVEQRTGIRPDYMGYEEAKITFSREVGFLHRGSWRFLSVAGDDVWFAGRTREMITAFFVVPLKLIDRAAGALELDQTKVTRIDWPDDNLSHNSQITTQAQMQTSGVPSLWVGTEQSGLVRFSKSSEGWSGRWYRSPQGVPAKIRYLTPARVDGRNVLLVKGDEFGVIGREDVHGIRDKNTLLVSLEPETGETTVLHLGQLGEHMAIVWPDGMKMPLKAYDQGVFPDRDLGEARFVNIRDVGNARLRCDDAFLTFDEHSDQRRMWEFAEKADDWDRIFRGKGVFELDKRTLKRRPAPLGRPFRELGPDHAHKRFLWRNVEENHPAENAVPDIEQVLAVGSDLWMRTSSSVIVYRPAPQGDPDWAENDLWIGPFIGKSNGRRRSVSKISRDKYGSVWLKSRNGIFRIDPEDLITHAKGRGYVTTTAGWRRRYARQQGQAAWRSRARAFFARDEHDKALALIRKELEELTTSEQSEGKREWGHLKIYEAIALAFSRRYEEALDVLDDVRAHGCEAAGFVAGRKRVKILEAQGRWRQVLDEIAQLEGVHPDFISFIRRSDRRLRYLISKDVLMTHSLRSSWNSTIAQARRELDKDYEPVFVSVQETEQHVNHQYDTQAQNLTIDVGFGIEMELVRIPAGEFMMGGTLSAEEVAERYGGNERHFAREHPRHRVRITRPFYISVTQVTQEQYEAVMGENPSEFRGARNPVDSVPSYKADEFCMRLSERTGLTVRLPTEAQWEYACRAGSDTAFSFGDRAEDLHLYANYADADAGSSGAGDGHDEDAKGTTPVASFKPNAWGLYDMHGNVWEWCFHGPVSYTNVNEPRIDPVMGRAAAWPVLRGGSWRSSSTYLRAACRGYNFSSYSSRRPGFRVVVLPEPPDEE